MYFLNNLLYLLLGSVYIVKQRSNTMIHYLITIACKQQITYFKLYLDARKDDHIFYSNIRIKYTHPYLVETLKNVSVKKKLQYSSRHTDQSHLLHIDVFISYTSNKLFQLRYYLIQWSIYKLLNSEY